MPEHIIIYTTCPDSDSAVHLARGLVSRKLAACVNILPVMTSIYEWQGIPQQGTEHLLMMKTTQACYSKIESFIQTDHPYELPEIICTPITNGLDSYLEWITVQTNG